MLQKKGINWINFLYEYSDPMEKFSLIPHYKGFNTTQIFSHIYRKNLWNSSESQSGPGSSMQETTAIRMALPRIIEKYKIKNFIDIPCGDLNWIRTIDLGVEHYFGGDIVSEIIDRNKTLYGNSTRTFEIINLLESILPNGDMFLCRDCLVHFSYEDIEKFLVNLHRSKIKYLLTTTFTSRQHNHDICTGYWRQINLEIAPFNFPNPIEVIVENSTERGGRDIDKSLALWEVYHLPQHLAINTSLQNQY
jgi:hypothetical protein